MTSQIFGLCPVVLLSSTWQMIRIHCVDYRALDEREKWVVEETKIRLISDHSTLLSFIPHSSKLALNVS